MNKNSDEHYILCRVNNQEERDKGGQYFIFQDKDKMIESANAMVTKLGWKVEDIMIFKSSTQLGKNLSIKLEVE